MIQIRVPARIHAGLIDLSRKGYRTNGGLGWSIEAPNLLVSASPAAKITLEDRRRHPLSRDEAGCILAELEQVAASEGLRPISLTVEGDLLPHRGFGGGTALRLAAIECMVLASGQAKAPNDLVRLSRRGGTSGIGIRTYFEGGLIFDVGHPGANVARPSRDNSVRSEPRQLLRLRMPDWPMGYVACNQLPAVSIEIERRLFAEVLPIEPSDVQNVLYQMVFGIMAAVAEDDPDTFAAAVDALQLGAWKRAEWACHSSILYEMADALRSAGARGLGLSSVGPALFFLADHLKIDCLPQSVANCIHLTRPTNRGRMVDYG